ncbi:MAG: molybdopterin molybdotransferase MoeA [Verrucomicrobiae bacterium]|nr:molybdopterin molybdotransferase MoeA [Verrucomicrobiae bacterium]
MISPEKALLKIQERLLGVKTPVSSLPLTQALGRMCARDVFARINLPPFDNSMMDGYALRAAETSLASAERIIDLDVQGQQPAGRNLGLALHPGKCIRIFTGAPIPSGADAVVMEEDVRFLAGAIFLEQPVAAGEFIRPAGEDVCQGQKILEAGQCLHERHLALLAAQGLDSVEVHAPPRVAVLTTGSELKPAGTPLQPGEIHESNGLMIQLLLRKMGLEPVMLGSCPDDLDLITSAIRNGLGAEALIIIGGMSVGAHDLVKSALKNCQVPQEFWQVAVRPGKPFLFSLRDQVPVFGLPGNPVSAFVTFQLFVRPALLQMQGHGELSLTNALLPLGEAFVNDTDRTHFVRGRIVRGSVLSAGRQASHILSSLASCSCLVKVPPQSKLAAGDAAPVLLL